MQRIFALSLKFDIIQSIYTSHHDHASSYSTITVSSGPRDSPTLSRISNKQRDCTRYDVSTSLVTGSGVMNLVITDPRLISLANENKALLILRE